MIATERGQGPLILDASAAVALVRQESASSAVGDVIERHRRAGGRLLVQDLFWFEITNVLARKIGATGEDIVDALRALDDLGVGSIGLNRPELLLTIDLAVRHRLSTYDAAYLALAQILDGQLLTLDTELAAAAGARAVPGPDRHQLAEEQALYGGETIDWSRFGRYLSELRAEAP